ncbi:uncharacterized protein EV420DRAFT_70351 [Desarmillaria tabescens]|uniref:F-box domain-containing protein n=1 Tax=Armillaria tabescens TaxID=1929756 RepID=A0AA39U3B4_ARMTA|nr:uncharacterized protein EV420DRAFT_70351 [Desarmillaria tabescens]KAK0469844.1 hypothetical protein EV420DRAFT_70351 [Desarmillaria tabescens]
MQRLPSLPGEIVDAIIDECHADSHTLVSCSLVSKQWFASSRYHLFSTIELSSKNSKIFSKLLGSPLCTITPFLNEISFHVQDDVQWILDLLSEGSYFGTVKTLNVFFYGVDLKNSLRDAILSHFSSITYLRVFAATMAWRSLVPDVRFICSFPRLENVLLYGHHQSDFHIDSSVRLPPNIRALKLDLPSPALDGIMQWLLAHEKLPTVSSLHIFRVQAGHCATLEKYTQACQDTLEDLMILLHKRSAEEEVNFDLRPNTNLNSIFLSAIGPDAIKAAGAVLSSLSSPYLRDVILRVPYVHLRQEGWGGLDAMLASHMQSVACTVVTDDTRNYGPELRKRLPTLNASGALQVVAQSRSKIAAHYLNDVYSRFKPLSQLSVLSSSCTIC